MKSILKEWLPVFTPTLLAVLMLLTVKSFADSTVKVRKVLCVKEVSKSKKDKKWDYYKDVLVESDGTKEFIGEGSIRKGADPKRLKAQILKLHAEDNLQ